MKKKKIANSSVEIVRISWNDMHIWAENPRVNAYVAGRVANKRPVRGISPQLPLLFSASGNLNAGYEKAKGENQMSHNPDLESLRHRIRVLELQCEEHKAKAKRLAVEANFYARQVKLAREEEKRE